MRAARGARWLAALVALALAASARAGGEPAATGAAGLSALLAGMRSTTGVVARFTESKELALLSSPLDCEGTIYFVPPGRLVRQVTRPAPSRLVVDGRNVRIEEAGAARAFDLDASPVARQLIDSFVVLFNGDEKRLRELYDATFAGSQAGWTLRLVPRSMPLDRMIASFELAGRDARIDRMVAAEPDGDRTVTVFGETDSAHRFSAAELEALFGPGPAR